jgi:hypothetical protein
MWKENKPAFESRLLVISTPFLEGGHYAQSPADFLPLVDQLQELHREGFVHGDIRGFNTAFAKDGGSSSFFDWDLGGKVEEVNYPKNYRAALVDGERLDRKGQVIRTLDDWWAFTFLALVKHDFTPPRSTEGGSSSLATSYSDLKEFIHRDAGEAVATHVANLKTFLQNAEANSWMVSPYHTYLKAAETVDAMGKATGSPPKDVEHGGNQAARLP